MVGVFFASDGGPFSVGPGEGEPCLAFGRSAIISGRGAGLDQGGRRVVSSVSGEFAPPAVLFHIGPKNGHGCGGSRHGAGEVRARA